MLTFIKPYDIIKVTSVNPIEGGMDMILRSNLQYLEEHDNKEWVEYATKLLVIYEKHSFKKIPRTMRELNKIFEENGLQTIQENEFRNEFEHFVYYLLNIS